MGTRSLIIMRVKKQSGKCKIYCVIYQQLDGYVSGVGVTLINFLSMMKLVNGIPLGENTTNMANGAGCLFAQVITHFKNGVGGCYIMPPNDDKLEEYNYFVDVGDDKSINITIKHGNEVLYEGSLEGAKEFIKYCENN